jgi:PHD/YefM family antitoxin component YafN of YafNO toxin-antitoxin module
MEPLTVTSKGRDRLVMLSWEEYARLKRRDRQVMGLEDFTEMDIRHLEQTRAPAEASAFDPEMNG